MLAVLENAIEEFQEYALAENLKGKALLHEVEEWLWDKDSDWFFSFESICETLKLSPEYLRQGLLLWKKTKMQDREITSPQPAVARRRTKAVAAVSRLQGR